MKKLRALPMVSFITLAAVACSEPTGPAVTGPETSFGLNGNGNGFLSGSHFNLNIIGVKNEKTAALEAQSDQGIGHRIFVLLYYEDDTDGTCWDGACPVDMKKTERTNKIILEKGTDFAVMDANATDKDGALFLLPEDVAENWLIFARPLGGPGRNGDVYAIMTTCGTVVMDPDPLVDGDEYEEVVCSLNNYVAFRDKGKSTAVDVTDRLFYLDVSVDPLAEDPLSTCLRNAGYSGDDSVPLFDPCFETYFWDYDNHGLKLLQLRIYPKPAA